MDIPVVELDSAFLGAMNDFLDKQIIGHDPTDELREIYQKRVLIDFSYLKAEKWYSPEHQAELQRLQKNGEIGQEIPKNVINPNFVTLIAMFEIIVEADDLEDTYDAIMDLAKFVGQFTEVSYQEDDICIYEPLMDVRFCQDINQYFNYLLTFKHKKLVAKQSS